MTNSKTEDVGGDEDVTPNILLAKTRLKCLKYANSAIASADDVLVRAEAFYQWVTTGKPPETQE